MKKAAKSLSADMYKTAKQRQKKKKATETEEKLPNYALSMREQEELTRIYI